MLHMAKHQLSLTFQFGGTVKQRLDRNRFSSPALNRKDLQDFGESLDRNRFSSVALNRKDLQDFGQSLDRNRFSSVALNRKDLQDFGESLDRNRFSSVALTCKILESQYSLCPPSVALSKCCMYLDAIARMSIYSIYIYLEPK